MSEGGRARILRSKGPCLRVLQGPGSKRKIISGGDFPNKR